MRRQSKTVTVRGVAIGGGSRVTVQSMTNTDTADRDATLAQIRALEREIEKQEQHSAELDRQIEAASSDYQELARLMAEKQSCDDALTGLMDEWERLSSDLEGAT